MKSVDIKCPECRYIASHPVANVVELVPGFLIPEMVECPTCGTEAICLQSGQLLPSGDVP